MDISKTLSELKAGAKKKKPIIPTIIINRTYKIATVDCETDPFNFNQVPYPFIWCYYDGNRYELFDDTGDFVKFVREKKRLIYAHNGGKFDYFYILNYLEPNDMGQRLMLINNRLAKWKLGKATMLDSYNIIPVPLKKLQKDDFDYEKLAADVRADHMPEIIKYIKSDCFNLYKYVKYFHDEYGYNLTIAGAALKIFMSITDHKKPYSNKNYYDLFYPYYYGGRVTPFKTGIFEGKFKCIDINSAYPYVMKKYKHPYSTKFYETKTPKESFYRECFFTVKARSQGALPMRTKKNGLDFPFDNKARTYHITGHELIAGLETKAVDLLSIIKAYRFENLISFDQYVDYFFARKQLAEKQGDKGKRHMAKIFLNGLYGKFASDYESYNEWLVGEMGTDPPEGYDHGPFMDGLQFFKRPLPEEKWRYLNVATSASITGAVRGYLWESINKCQDPYYCDTDSIIYKGYANLKLCDKLGQWKLEGTGDKLAIAGKKLYCLTKAGEKIKLASKGVKLSCEEIEAVASGETVTWYNPVPTYSILTGKTSFVERDIKLVE